jgi:hypothetical protein
LDPGKLIDFNGLAVIRVTRQAGEQYNQYKLISLERQRRESYEVTAAWAKTAFMNPLLRGDSVTFKPIFVIDAGGVGEPLADTLRRLGISPIRLKYTGADGFNAKGRTITVSKVLMVSVFMGINLGGRFSMPPRASFEGLFKSELRDFRGEMGRLDHIRFSAEEGKHDDLVMAVIQGCWFGEMFIKPKRAFKVPAVASFSVGRLGDPEYENLSSSEPWGIAWDPTSMAKAEGEARRLKLEEEERSKAAAGAG